MFELNQVEKELIQATLEDIQKRVNELEPCEKCFGEYNYATPFEVSFGFTLANGEVIEGDDVDDNIFSSDDITKTLLERLVKNVREPHNPVVDIDYGVFCTNCLECVE